MSAVSPLQLKHHVVESLVLHAQKAHSASIQTRRSVDKATLKVCVYPMSLTVHALGNFFGCVDAMG